MKKNCEIITYFARYNLKTYRPERILKVEIVVEGKVVRKYNNSTLRAIDYAFKNNLNWELHTVINNERIV